MSRTISIDSVTRIRSRIEIFYGYLRLFAFKYSRIRNLVSKTKKSWKCNFEIECRIRTIEFREEGIDE